MGSSKPHFTGNRVEDISFRKGLVSCDCGAEFKVKIESEQPIGMGHDTLAAAFWSHRKAESVKAGVTL